MIKSQLLKDRYMLKDNNVVILYLSLPTSQLGFGDCPATIKGGERISTANSYLRPAMSRANLKVVTNAYVTKVRHIVMMGDNGMVGLLPLRPYLFFLMTSLSIASSSIPILSIRTLSNGQFSRWTSSYEIKTNY